MTRKAPSAWEQSRMMPEQSSWFSETSIWWHEWFVLWKRGLHVPTGGLRYSWRREFQRLIATQLYQSPRCPEDCRHELGMWRAGLVRVSQAAMPDCREHLCHQHPDSWRHCRAAIGRWMLCRWMWQRRWARLKTHEQNNLSVVKFLPEQRRMS